MMLYLRSQEKLGLLVVRSLARGAYLHSIVHNLSSSPYRHSDKKKKKRKKVECQNLNQKNTPDVTKIYPLLKFVDVVVYFIERSNCTP